MVQKGHNIHVYCLCYVPPAVLEVFSVLAALIFVNYNHVTCSELLTVLYYMFYKSL